MAEEFQERAKNEIHLPNDLTTFMDISTDANPLVMKIFGESYIKLSAAWVGVFAYNHNYTQMNHWYIMK